MVETHEDFEERLNVLGRKHTAMGKGYTTRVRGDGLIVVKPKRQTRRGFPVRGLLGLVVGFFLFKAFMMASLGETTYGERIGKLSDGTALEQAGAWLMQLDPATRYLAGLLEPVIG
ncbi:MAG: hypothetical protein AAGF36_15030 [Pseudomonadota bacterium]